MVGGNGRLGGRTRQNQLSARQLLRIKAHRGAKKAILAVAASMLTAADHVRRDALSMPTLAPVTSTAIMPKRPFAACSNASPTSGVT